MLKVIVLLVSVLALCGCSREWIEEHGIRRTKYECTGKFYQTEDFLGASRGEEGNRQEIPLGEQRVYMQLNEHKGVLAILKFLIELNQGEIPSFIEVELPDQVVDLAGTNKIRFSHPVKEGGGSLKVYEAGKSFGTGSMRGDKDPMWWVLTLDYSELSGKVRILIGKDYTQARNGQMLRGVLVGAEERRYYYFEGTCKEIKE
jgi:hypothetical protein